ncbi:src like adaptor 1a isoform X2 [Cyclopterus lumpus]|uniref:src like adaptor 1a isoform X2 n=1 Tax=Cyclopterus lumpus TaxID=8103 RepID=UPI0014864717|nr:src like adaptor 1a isoform X2 [Cyclopterus lumpus]
MGNIMRGVSSTGKVNTDSSIKVSEDDMVVVLQDYPLPEISEPIYRMGEKLRLIAQEAYWWRVRSVQTQKENYIPNSHVAKVYHGWLFEGVERQKAEELLCLPGNRVGSFLVRESARERDFADGLCCALTSPCLSGMTPPPAASPGAPPVVMRRNFDWKKIDRRQLVSTDSRSDNMVSYGVRNSIAAYLSFSGNQNSEQTRAESRKKKSKSVYALPENGLGNIDYEEDF